MYSGKFIYTTVYAGKYICLFEVKIHVLLTNLFVVLHAVFHFKIFPFSSEKLFL